MDSDNERPAPRRFVQDASNFDEAERELERKRIERAGYRVPQTRHRPKFDDFARKDLESPTLAQTKELIPA